MQTALNLRYIQQPAEGGSSGSNKKSVWFEIPLLS